MANNRQKKVFNLFVAFSVILICTVIFAAPILSQLIEKQLEFYLKKVDDVDVRFESIQVKILPPKLTAKNVVVVGKKNVALSSFKTDQIDIIPRLGPGFLGHINIKQVKISDPYIELRQVKNKKVKQKEKKSVFSLPKLQDFISVMVETIDWGKATVQFTTKKDATLFCTLFDSESSLLISKKEDVFKLKSKVQLRQDEQQVDIDYINLSLSRSDENIALSSLNILSEALNVKVEGALMPMPRLNYSGLIDFHQLWDVLSALDMVSIPNNIYGKLNFSGSLENSWQKPLIKAELDSPSMDLWRRNLSSFKANIEASHKQLNKLKANFLIGKGQVSLVASNVGQSGQGKANLKIKHLPIETFITTIDPDNEPPLRGSLDIESEGTLSFDVKKINMPTRIVSKQLKIMLEPEVERFAPIVFNKVELASLLRVTPGNVLSIEEGDLKTEGLKGKFSLDIIKGGGVNGKWLGEIYDFSGIFKKPYPVQGTGQFLGGIRAKKDNFTANIEVDVNDFSYEGSSPSQLAGNIIFKNSAVSFQDIVIKNSESQLNAQVETSSVNLKNNFVKSSFKNFDLSLIAKIAGRAYPFIKELNGNGDGQIYVNTEDKVNGSLKLNANKLNYKGLSFNNAALDVLIKNNTYVFKESSFDGGDAKLLVSGEITENNFNNLNIKASNLDIASLNLPSALDLYFDTVSGYLKFNGAVDNPNIDSQLQCTAAKNDFESVAGYTCEASIQGALNDLTWTLNAGENKISSKGKFQFDTQYLELNAELNDFALLPIYKTMPTRLSAAVNLSGKINKTSTMFGDVNINQIVMQRQTEKIFNQTPLGIQIKQGIVTIPKTHFIDDKKTDLEFSGTVSSSLVDMKLQGNLDMQNLLILNIGLERSEGIGTVDLDISGKPNAVNYQGSLSAKDAFIKLEAFPHPFEQLTFNSELQQNVLFVNELKSELGGGDLSLFGEISLKPYFLDSIVNLQGQGERINLRFPTWLPVEVSGPVFFKGPMSAPTLGGDFTVLNGQYEDKWDWQSRVLTLGSQKYIERVYSDEDISMYFDMSFKTTGNTFRLRNNIAQGTLNGEVKLIGNNQKIGLLGSIEITNGEVEFLDNIFELENGAITFANPNDIDPKFDLRATTTVAQKNIILDITSEGEDIVALLSSDPFLDETSIVTLLTVGVEADEFLNSESQANRLSSSFLPSVLSSPIQSRLEKGLRDVNVVDTLQFIPYFSEEQQSTGLRVLIGKNVFPRFRVLYSTDLLQTNSERNLRLQQNFSRNLSIQGNIRDNNNTVSNDEQIDFGLDFEFRFDF